MLFSTHLHRDEGDEAVLHVLGTYSSERHMQCICKPTPIIGASLSKPHTSDLDSVPASVCIIYTYIINMDISSLPVLELLQEREEKSQPQQSATNAAREERLRRW